MLSRVNSCLRLRWGAWLKQQGQQQHQQHQLAAFDNDYDLTSSESSPKARRSQHGRLWSQR
eukprot:10894918-Alexandrium_andersonii.AAC.1